MKDVVESDGNMSLSRKDVYHSWARITVSIGSNFGKDGLSIGQSRDVRTHKIMIRFRRDIDFTQTVWFYEERLQSAGRWFKVIAWQDYDEAANFLEADVRLVERGAVLSPPTEPNALNAVVDLPPGVAL
jgi:head-tail adaptor